MMLLKFISLLLFFSFQNLGFTAEYEIKSLKILEINSSINPATLNYLENNLKKLSKNKGNAVVIKLDTPGGLVTTTKAIITLIGSVDYPVIIWITPEGASATSAGAIIASAAHVLVMSAGTNIGAATPVGLGKDIKKSDGKAKAINDLVALVTSLSNARGRNAKKFELMISEASSFDSQTALKDKIIDGIVNSQVDLIKFINDREVKILGELQTLKVSNFTEIKIIEMDPGQRILNIFSNPMTAYILFIIGAALLYFEFQAPGGFIAGGVGVFCLVLAGIGFQVLPLNFGALGLVILSFILFILEAYITSYGVLTLSGVAALIFGSLFLFRTENAYLDIQLPMIFSVVAAIVIYVVIIGMVIIRSRGKKQTFFTTVDHEGHITNCLGLDGDLYNYQVKVNGEIWNTSSKTEFLLHEKVNITSQDNDKNKITIEKLK
jgi:membrane-bound serine protease (ClpP class)